MMRDANLMDANLLNRHPLSDAYFDSVSNSRRHDLMNQLLMSGSINQPTFDFNYLTPPQFLNPPDFYASPIQQLLAPNNFFLAPQSSFDQMPTTNQAFRNQVFRKWMPPFRHPHYHDRR